MRALVTGAGGFLGGAVARRLRERGDGVRSLSRGAYPELARLGIEHVQGDVAEAGSVLKAARGCDVVFHVAAKAGAHCRHGDFHRANVVGTERVVAACRALGIPRLVYTSTPSVVFRPHDVEGADESLAYARDFLGAHYPRTKAEAERLVLAASDAQLATCALRPHLVWGPGDTNLTPRLLARARAGRLRRVGDGRNLVDVTYIDDAAEAHLLAADRLEPGGAVAGRAYFLSQGEPVACWPFIDRILAAAGLGPVERSIPLGAAYRIGWLLERLYGLVRSRREPPMTRFVALQLGTSHHFDISRARRELGYAPRVSAEEGLGRLAAELGGGRTCLTGPRG